MSIEVWLSFIAASMALCFTPGPTVFLVMAQALNHGKKSVLPLICGVLCGDLIAMSLSLFGVGALLSASATLFGIVKWLGAAYLVYLGIKAWCTKVEISSVKPKESQPINSKTVFRDSLMVTALNPKGIVFFMAFLPLFINAESKVLPQMLILSVSFLAVSAASASFYAVFSGVIRNRVRSVKFQNWFNKLSGGMMCGAGVVTATIQK
ncbi:LysE family translocator [Shewanella sp. 202IG2-18]|uniref:LysE family translocator n=1 Tax=Parashewanella hymeniacidonis TaxID=2807618 RepID=UPI0019606BF9|nr:LysE family translocator [Parashewanella hymeniacidonis]MBM7073757.1 LysE family translocator [Parashewanella hymeniacidonis]